jgi:formylglycine-generating enzyme required for sulfatase activity
LVALGCARLTAVYAHIHSDRDRPLWEQQVAAARQLQQQAARDAGAPMEMRIDLDGEVTMQFVFVPAGEFLMGSPDSGEYPADEEYGRLGRERVDRDWERPQHRVRITRPFYMGRFEVTQEQWQAVMGSNPSRTKGAKYPVHGVTWEDCDAFVARLNEEFGKDGMRFSLPTEAEWEYACRAGTSTSWSYGGPWASSVEYAWCRRDGSRRRLHAVGQKKPNAWGLYDMHGNVRECCSDWWDPGYYAVSPRDDPTGPNSGDARVARGGSCHDGPSQSRSASRGTIPTSGLRVVLRVPSLLSEITK